MSAIKIVSTPPGQAPEWVRQEWIGAVIPLPKQSSVGIQVGARGGKPQNLGGYQVETTEAMKELGKKSPEAVKWWEGNVPLKAIPRLVFSRDVCELVQ
ncbi:MAG: hypothetical protein WCS89_04195 [Candidatus Paceibacterota bacterium]